MGNGIAREQKRFGWTLEDVELILRPMAETGHEPVGAMGNDAALAALAHRPRVLFDYFHQLFAQVTNPPIDPIREELVMSIMTYIGNEGNILAETPEHARLVKMTRPVLTDDELARLRDIPDFPAKTLAMYFDGGLKAALDKLSADAIAAVKDGAKIIVLSDRNVLAAKNAADAKRIPSLLAVAAVNKALVESGARPSVGIVVESGEVREVHHFAVLLGFGATAVNPYLALATVADIAADAGRPVAAPYQATANYVSAVCKGLMKIMSKMGISTLRSYRSARIFEAVGLGPKIVAEYFTGVTSPVGGLELEDIEKIVGVKSWSSEFEFENGTFNNSTLQLKPPTQNYSFALGCRGGEQGACRCGSETLRWHSCRVRRSARSPPLRRSPRIRRDGGQSLSRTCDRH